jgi:hypothetical protein
MSWATTSLSRAVQRALLAPEQRDVLLQGTKRAVEAARMPIERQASLGGGCAWARGAAYTRRDAGATEKRSLALAVRGSHGRLERDMGGVVRGWVAGA